MQRVLWMVLAGLFFAAGSAQAHCGKCGVGDPPKAGMTEGITEKLNELTKDLKLSDEQRVQVEAVLKEKMEKKQKIMEQKKADMDALHEDVKAKLKKVLSEEQLKTWEAKTEEKGKMKGDCPYCEKGKLCPMCQKMQGMGHEGMGHEGMGQK